MITAVYNRLLALLDPEVRMTARIIGKFSPPSRDAGNAECDELFRQRLRIHPGAFRMSFWESHFEWRALKDYPEIGGHVLDFGCGAGHADILLSRAGYRIHGIDLSSLAIEIAGRLRDAETAEVRSRVSFECADVVAPRNGGPLYESVWSTDVFEHIRDPQPAIEGLRRWVLPDAPILISVPLGYAFDDPGHVHHWADAEHLRAHFAGFLDVKKVVSDDARARLRLVGRL